MDNEAKTCKVCGRMLTLDHYRKTTIAPNGVSTCKECEGNKRSEIWAAKRASIGGEAINHSERQYGKKQ